MAKRTLVLDTVDIEEILSGNLSPKLRDKLVKSTKTIKVSSAKGKARNLQHSVCEMVSELTGIPFDQSDDSCLIHSREMGQHGVDVVLRGSASVEFPFSIECKSCESLNLLEAINQAKANQKPENDFMLIHKRKALSEPVVIISMSAFKRLWRKRVSS